MAVSVTLGAESPARFKGSLLAIPLAENPELSGPLSELDTALGGAIRTSIDSRFFRAGKDEVFYLSGSAGAAARVALVGMGKAPDRRGSLRRAAAVAARHATKLGGGDIGFYVGNDDADEIEAVTVGLLAGSWEYKDLKSPPPENEQRQSLIKATILGVDND